MAILSRAQERKGCDDSCGEPECSHILCHDGEASGVELVACEECSQPFCKAHLVERELSIFLCGPCAIADADRQPVTVDQARELLKFTDKYYALIDWYPPNPPRRALVSRVGGIVYEGQSI